jgi:hypothetical protein
LPIGWLIVLFLIVAAAFSSPSVRWWVSRRRWREADTAVALAHAAWEELGDDLRDIGLEWRGTTDTPRRAAAALLATRRLHYDQAAQQALGRLARAEELARYASPTAPIETGADLRADVRVVRRALFDSVPRARRWRARALPPSTGRFFAGVFGDVTDYFRNLGRRLTDAARAKLPAR